MTNVNKGMGLLEISKLPGVADLHVKVRGPFAQALRAEAMGDAELAETKLSEAVEAEQSL